MRTYTDEELKFLYALDPHGVSYYVHRNSLELSGVENQIAYKNRIFEMLFNREPKGFIQHYDGRWVETEINENTNLNAVHSESESYFGFRNSPLEGTHAAEAYIRFAIDAAKVFFSALGAIPVVGTYISTIGDVILIAVRAFIDGVENVNNDIAEFAVGQGLDKYLDKLKKSSILTFINTYTSLLDLSLDLSSNNAYAVEMIEYYTDSTPFRVFLKIGNSFHEMKDIREAIESMS